MKERVLSFLVIGISIALFVFGTFMSMNLSHRVRVLETSLKQQAEKTEALQKALLKCERRNAEFTFRAAKLVESCLGLNQRLENQVRRMTAIGGEP